MTSAQVVETSVKVTSNSPSQDYTHPDDHNLLTYDMTPGFKPFTIIPLLYWFSLWRVNNYNYTELLLNRRKILAVTTQLKQLRKESLKKIQAWTGFEPMTPAMLKLRSKCEDLSSIWSFIRSSKYMFRIFTFMSYYYRYTDYYYYCYYFYYYYYED